MTDPAKILGHYNIEFLNPRLYTKHFPCSVALNSSSLTKVKCHCTYNQADLDKVRKELNRVRESVREKRLAKERAEAEKLKALEESQPTPAGGRDSKTKGKKKKK